MPDSDVAVYLRLRKKALLKKEQALMREMAREWLKVERALLSEMEALALALMNESMVTQALVLKHERFIRLAYQARAEAAKYNAQVEALITKWQETMSKEGVDDALRALTISFLEAGEVVPVFNRLNTRALEMMFGYASDGSSLAGLLAKNYPEAVSGLLDALVTGLAKGMNPTKVAREMADRFGMGLSRALVVARTETLRAYRMGSFEQYRESGVVMGYKRLAAHDTEVCPGCLFRDGEMIESLDGEFDEHPNGRCTAVPVVMGIKEPTWQSGVSWFKSQPEADQRSILGEARFEAWKDGASLEDMSKFVSNPTWGGSYVPTPVKEL
jgi:SPP1 gp7 family putative phage head morphogenesis protein